MVLHGNMACGFIQDDLIGRIGPEKHAALLKKPHARPFDMTGRPMRGWLVVEPDGIKTAKQLGVEFAMTLPAK